MPPRGLPTTLSPRALHLQLTSYPRIPRILRPLSTAAIRSRTTTFPRTSAPISPSPATRYLHPRTPIAKAAYTTSPTGKSTSDVIVEELQDLYETAKDEFEIATESTDGATIYAASDREAAREALNELLAVYALYTRDVSVLDAAGRAGVEKVFGVEDGAEAPATVDTGLNPQGVDAETRAEVRRRVGQRVRELKGGVELLEERGKED